METFIIIVLAFWAGWSLSKWWQSLVFKSIIDDLGITDEKLMTLLEDKSAEEPQEILEIEVRIEQHGDQLYAYRKSDDHFLGQGRDRERLLERLKSEFSGDVKLIITQEDGADLIKNG
jgi:hypothetical protein